MKNFYSFFTFLFLLVGISVFAQQLPNNQFEDWSGPKYDGKEQPASWNYCNVTQAGFSFNFAHKESGRSGYCMMVQDQDLEVMGIGETSPGYVSLGRPWVYLEGLNVKGASAGTEGGISWNYRPDTMAVWIKRTGSNAMSEDFHLLYYAWSGTAYSNVYKSKDGNCASTGRTDEESDIRISLDYNECGTVTPGTQICEGWLYDRKVYNNWTLIKVPIYYMNDIIPEKMNVIFSASNYPNFRANDGLYAGNSLYIDDAQLIYSSKIQQLIINNEEWKGFNPNATGVQTYVLKDGVETMPTIKAKRGAGQLTNKRGKTEVFRGRSLSSNEYTITPGVIDETPTLITVYAEDGSSQTTYQILFAHQASNNAQLSGIKVNGQTVKSFSPYSYNYTAEVEYGSTEAPVVTVIKQEDKQTVTFTQPSSINDVTTITVTAADGVTTKTYTVRYQEAQLSDNTLQDILVNGISIPDFSPNKTNYRVSIPLGTTQMPTVEAVSKYPDGMQTIVQTPPSVIDGGIYKISVTSPGNPSPKEYKLTFVLELSSYCKLKDIQLDGVSIDGFSPDVTSYSISLPLGTTSLPAITYTPGDPYQTISVELGELDGTTRIVVTAANGDTQVYKLLFTTAKSTISTLDGITLDGVMLPGFAPDVTNYTMQLPIGTTELPMIDVIKGDPYETVTIRTGGLNGVTRITVQAGNGTTTIYQITFSITQATDATLQAITIAGVDLPNFDPNRLEYSYSLPKGTTELPVIAYTPHDQYQTITTRSGGVNGDYKITVRPQSGASQTYVIHFSVPKSDNAQLQMIYLDGTPLPDFAPETLTYTDTLDNNTYPQVTYTPNDGQKIISYLDDNIHTIKVTAESGKSLTYTIQFVVRVSESAFLKMIYLDQKPLEGFLPEQLHYKNIYIAPNASPRITVDSDEGQQVTILSPASDGTAQIIVSANSGSHNTYLLELVDTTITPHPHLDPIEPYVPANDATLQTILADGVALPDFDADQDTYTITLPAGATVPAITFVPNDEKQSVAAGQIAHNLHQAIVTAEDGTSRTYTVHIECELYHNAYLLDLQVAGQQIQFQPQTLDYHFTLDRGQALPEITYLAAPGQTVMMVAKDDATQQLIVTAQDGTTNTYVLFYTRVTSSNALLRDIVINGESLDGFDPNIFDYTYTLPFRAPYVPAVNAIEAIHGQTITTYHSAPKGITRIHVVAEDNVTSSDYTIVFPTVLSSNTELANIELEAAYSVPEINFDPDQTEYTVLIPLAESKAPNIVFERAQKEQTVTLIARPIGQTSQVIVQAENGDERTYSISFQHDAAPVSNTLKSIIIAELDTAIDMSDPDQREWDIALPYGASSMTVLYEKNFDKQTVLVEPGGLYHPTRLTVLSNNSMQPTTVYTLRPQINRQNPAILTGITINGVALDGFNSNRFSYIVPTTSTPIVVPSYGNGSQCVILVQDSKHWQAMVTNNGYTNIYDLWFYYSNDVIPNGEFTDWTTAKYNKGPKPVSWQVVADAVDNEGTYTSGGEVKQNPTGVAYLYSRYPGLFGVGGIIPGFITLGTVAGHLGVAGSSTFQINGGIPFHNTPDVLSIRYKAPTISDNNRIVYQLTGTNGLQELIHKDTKAIKDYTTLDLDLTSITTAAGNPSMMNIILNSYYQESGTTADGKAEMYVDYVRFAYNNTLNGILVNGQAAEREGNTFSYTLNDPELVELPLLDFDQAVADQAQQVVWAEPQVSGEYSLRTATITNYGEDGLFSTYMLHVQRPLYTNANLRNLLVNGAQIAGFKSTTYNYTYILPFGATSFPDVTPTLASNMQSCQTSLLDSTVTIVVTAEHGEQQTYTITFATEAAHAQLANISANGMTSAFAPDVFDYTIRGNEWPTISVEKAYDAQLVTMHDGVIDVTALGGATAQYRLQLQPNVPVTSGQLAELELDGNPLADFQPDHYLYEAARPTLMNFVRQDASDSVVYIQQPDTLKWIVYGTQTHQYTLTQPSGQSSSTNLKGIYLDGILLDGFDAQIHDYTLFADTAMQLSVLGENTSQTIDIVWEQPTYTIVVTNPSGEQGTPYTLTLLPAQSADASLQAIYLDGELVQDYHPHTFAYDIMLPAGAYKVAEPMVPNITYRAADPKATVELELGGLDENTYLYVTSSDGTIRSTYSLHFTAEPSHNAQLTAIATNDVPLEDFESGRHYYSVLSNLEHIVFDWRSDDRFQTVSVDTLSPTQYALHVVAQDGITSEDYFIDVFAKAQSGDATLENILINGLPMNEFRPDLNPDLMFNSGLNKYTINIPANLVNLPHVSATLKLDAQTVEMRQVQSTIYLDVTAEDGSVNTYTLRFVGNLSQNTALKAIYLNGESYADFHADQHFYFIDLPNGEHAIPDLIPLKAEAAQQCDTASVSLSIGHQVNITVTAEDGMHQAEYVLVFQLHPSDVDTLKLLTADSLHYQSSVFNYHISIPYNAAHQFPDLDWEPGDNYQMVRLDTLEHSALILTRQLVVTAESGRRNRYTVTYSMEPSRVTTLNMIYINGTDSLPGFVPTTTDYVCTLPIGTTLVPQLEADYDANTQTVEKRAIEPIIPQALAATQFVVTAQSGDTRIYTVHMVVAPDTATTLNMIFCNGQPVPRFDERIMDYTISFTQKDATLPIITFTKHDEQQQVDIIRIDESQVEIRVTAADGQATATYSLLFLPYLSNNNQLAAILLNDTMLADFSPEQDAYEIKVATMQDLPTVTYLLAEPEQQVVTTTDYRYTPEGLPYDVIHTLKVVPENQVDTGYYELVFHIKANTPIRPEESENALLRAIYLRDQLLSQTLGFDSDFAPEVFNYSITYPVGTDPALFYTASDLKALPQDSLAIIVGYDTEVKRTAKDTDDIDVVVANCLHITVQAPAGNLLTYNIYQQVLLDSLNRATELIIADYLGQMRPLGEFEPGVFYYEYMLADTRTNAPAFELHYANTDSRFACVRLGLGNNSRVVDADDDTNYQFDDSEDDPTYHIYYRAENGDKYTYKIKFRRSPIKRAQKPMEGDVLIQHIPGSCQIAVASLRANVMFGLYDMTGRMIQMVKLEEGNPNDFQTTTDGYGQTYFGHVSDISSCAILTLEPNKVYFWAFTENGKRKIRSGKLVIMPK